MRRMIGSVDSDPGFGNGKEGIDSSVEMHDKGLTSSMNGVGKQEEDDENEMGMGEDDQIEGFEKYPYCIVWTPIPLLTWILPMVGHMGICKSNGVIYDFGLFCLSFIHDFYLS